MLFLKVAIPEGFSSTRNIAKGGFFGYLNHSASHQVL